MHTFTLSKTQTVLNAIKEACTDKVKTHIKTVVLPQVLRQVEAEIDTVVAQYLSQLSLSMQDNPMMQESRICFLFPQVTKENQDNDQKMDT